MRWDGIARRSATAPPQSSNGTNAVSKVSAALYSSIGVATWASAGFPPVLLHGPGGTTLYRAEGPPLGIVPGMDFPCQQATLDGRSLYLFSDGATDARDTSRQVLGVDGVVALFMRHAQWRPETRLRRIVGDLRRRQLGDDTTLLMIEAAA